MALIGTLRNKMTKWVVGFITVAISAFVLNDLFGSGPRSVFGHSNTVGEIGGSTISLEEYQAAIQERENNYILNFGRQPGDRERPLLQQQAWDLLVVKKAIKPQFEKVGVQVTTEEVWDMIQGKNIDENVKSSFLDSAGNFDRPKLIQYINQFNTPAPINNPQLLASFNEAKYRWSTFQSDLGLGRERIKYENLLIKTNYVTDAEAERDYHTQNDVAEVKYLYVPYFVVSDSAIKVADSNLKDYYNRNKEKYKAEQTRSLSYVSFPVQASASDSAQIRQELEKISADFKTVTEDSVFAAANTEGAEPFAKYTTATLPTFLANKKNELAIGNVIGPFLDGGSFKVVKIVAFGRDTIGNAQASHILIKWDDESEASKKAAKEKARKILNDIKGGASFAAKASEFGTDGTATRGGDLGSFSTGQMVKPFEQAVFSAKKTGLLNDVVETQFGYHIIDVTSLADYTSYSVATVELVIAPSDETQNEAFLKAQTFASDLSGVDNFKETAKRDNLVVMDANDLKTADRRINDLGDARTMVTWLFREAKIGKASDVFDLDDDYVVAIMTGETKAGFRSLDAVKEEITPAVRNEVKGKQIIEKLNAQKGTLEEMAKLFGTDATVGSSSDLKLNSNTLPSVGLDPVAVGKIFSLENGKRSQPFAGENGVLIAELQNKTIAPAVGEYSMFRNQLLQGLNGKSAYAISEALKHGANIEDERYKFF
jgi:peptidyl-prolyl cis-trans isomerase D